jgi:alpha-galactosidase
VHQGRVEFHGDPADPVYAVEYGTSEQTVLLVYARRSRPAEVWLRPRTLDASSRYHVAGTQVHLTGRQAANGIQVPFALASDADVVVLQAVR